MILPHILTIAGSDSSGGAGIQADLKTISALGAYGASVITALTAQNTLGVQGIHEVPAGFIEQQFDAVAGDIKIDATKTGMLSHSGAILAVVKKVREYQIENLVVDPVMVATSGSALMTDDAKQTLMTSLVPLARIITPNIPEAQVLSGLVITSKEDMQQAAVKIHQLGVQNVLVKGGHLDEEALDILYDGEQFHEFVEERINTQNTHGTGCTLSAAIAVGLAQGKTVVEAIRMAKEYITTAIRFSLDIGKGHGPLNHTASLFREAECFRCLEALKQAVERLKAGRYGHIVPEIQSNLGYALPDAGEQSDVAAFPGRVVNVRDKIDTLCDPEFGASQHVAKIILTVMRYKPEYRAAMAVRFSEEALDICRNADYQIASFDRRDEPQDVKLREGSSLEWGTNAVLAERNSIPDAIFDLGDVGKEPVIRILGKTPDEVVEKVIHIAEVLHW